MMRFVKIFVLAAVAVCFSSCHAFAQTGIVFEQGSDWENILKKAKAVDKYVFVDCYATWCIPCKKMDDIVYSNDTVGAALNSRFISIKVQMDTGKNDTEQIIGWYRSAKEIKKKYNVSAYPTYLFFSPRGEIVHKGVGYLNAEEFVSLSQMALDSTKQLYALERKFRNKALSPLEIIELTRIANQAGESELVKSIADEFVSTLMTLEKGEVFQRDNISLLLSFSSKSTDSGFRFIMENAKKIDSVMKMKNAAKQHIQMVIYNEAVFPVIQTTFPIPEGHINWDSIQKNILRKYPKRYALEPWLYGKVQWYRYKKNWSKYCESIVKYVDAFKSEMDNGNINDYAWYVFQYGHNHTQLQRAKDWVMPIILSDTSSLLPNSWDTYANLLYKSGEVTDAIVAQQKAISLATRDQQKMNFKERLEKMKAGKPTWIYPVQ